MARSVIKHTAIQQALQDDHVCLPCTLNQHLGTDCNVMLSQTLFAAIQIDVE